VKIRIKAREMHDAEATHVSLVPRGANMIPFRILKDEDGDTRRSEPMLNFRQIFKVEEPKPAVLAIVVPKDTEQARKACESRGFSVEKTQELEGAFAYVQGDVELGQSDQVTVQFAPDVAAIVRLKRFEPFGDSTSFTENLEKNGFLPGFDMALGVLRETVFNALFDAENPSGASSTIDKAVKEFRAHVADMTNALPESAFKLDPSYDAALALKGPEAVEKASVENFTMTVNIGAETSVGAPAVSSTDPTQTEGGEEVAVSPAVSGSSSSLRKEGDPATDGGEEGAATAAASEGDAGQDVVKGEEDERITALLSAVEALTTKVDSAVTGITEQVDALSTRVEAAEVTAKAADEAVSGLTGGEPVGDPEPREQGNETFEEPVLIDTGYERLRAS
jgi:hypothetical protein